MLVQVNVQNGVNKSLHDDNGNGFCPTLPLTAEFADRKQNKGEFGSSNKGGIARQLFAKCSTPFRATANLQVPSQIAYKETPCGFRVQDAVGCPYLIDIFRVFRQYRAAAGDPELQPTYFLVCRSRKFVTVSFCCFLNSDFIVHVDD